jgi:hypothetical protein
MAKIWCIFNVGKGFNFLTIKYLFLVKNGVFYPEVRVKKKTGKNYFFYKIIVASPFPI